LIRQYQEWLDFEKNITERLDALEKVFSGELSFLVTPSTATHKIADLNGATPPTDTVTIKLVDDEGNVYTKYNGPIKLAIADTSTNGTAAITPSSTTPSMTNGVYTVTVSYTKASTGWANAETATLTVSDPDTDGIAGWSVASATFTMTAET